MHLPIELVDEISIYIDDIDTQCSMILAIPILNKKKYNELMTLFSKGFIPEIAEMVGGYKNISLTPYLQYGVNYKKIIKFVPSMSFYNIQPSSMSSNIMVGQDNEQNKFICIKYSEVKKKFTNDICNDVLLFYSLIFYEVNSKSKMWKTTICKDSKHQPDSSINYKRNYFLHNDTIHNSDSIYDADVIGVCKDIIFNKFIYI